MASNYVKIVADEEELKWFFENIMPPLKSTEVYFLSLSARNKYLTPEERQEVGLGRTEMFCKSLLRKREFSRFMRLLHRLECDERGYLTKTGQPIPSKTIVCYWNINPSDSIKALNLFQNIVNEYMLELASIAATKRDPGSIFDRINKLDNSMENCYQQATGTKHWLDIDMDVDKRWNPLHDKELVSFLIGKGLKKSYFMETKSGYHLLVNRQELKFNPDDIIKKAQERYYHFCLETTGEVDTACKMSLESEIIKNGNDMVVIPGTFQGGFIPRILNKDGLL